MNFGSSRTRTARTSRAIVHKCSVGANGEPGDRSGGGDVGPCRARGSARQGTGQPQLVQKLTSDSPSGLFLNSPSLNPRPWSKHRTLACGPERLAERGPARPAEPRGTRAAVAIPWTAGSHGQDLDLGHANPEQKHPLRPLTPRFAIADSTSGRQSGRAAPGWRGSGGEGSARALPRGEEGGQSPPLVEAKHSPPPAPHRTREPQASAERSEPGEKVPRGSAAWKRGTESPSCSSSPSTRTRRRDRAAYRADGRSRSRPRSSEGHAGATICDSCAARIAESSRTLSGRASARLVRSVGIARSGRRARSSAGARRPAASSRRRGSSR